MSRLITRNEIICPSWESTGYHYNNYPYIWIRIVFCDESEGFPGKEHIEVRKMDASHETLSINRDNRSDLEKFLEGWTELDPIEYKDGKTKDVPTYYLKVDDERYFLAFVLDYDPTPKYYHPHVQIDVIDQSTFNIFNGLTNVEVYPMDDMQIKKQAKELEAQTIDIETINKEIKAIWSSNEDKKEV